MAEAAVKNAPKTWSLRFSDPWLLLAVLGIGGHRIGHGLFGQQQPGPQAAHGRGLFLQAPAPACRRGPGPDDCHRPDRLRPVAALGLSLPGPGLHPAGGRADPRPGPQGRRRGPLAAPVRSFNTALGVGQAGPDDVHGLFAFGPSRQYPDLQQGVFCPTWACPLSWCCPSWPSRTWA